MDPLTADGDAVFAGPLLRVAQGLQLVDVSARSLEVHGDSSLAPHCGVPIKMTASLDSDVDAIFAENETARESLSS